MYWPRSQHQPRTLERARMVSKSSVTFTTSIGIARTWWTRMSSAKRCWDKKGKQPSWNYIHFLSTCNKWQLNLTFESTSRSSEFVQPSTGSREINRKLGSNSLTRRVSRSQAMSKVQCFYIGRRLAEAEKTVVEVVEEAWSFNRLM